MKMISFKKFLEEDAPINNIAATPGVAGATPETIGVKVKKKKEQLLLRRKI